MLWITILVISMINLVSTVLYILSSFGNAILFQIGWQICSATSQKVICSGQIYEAVFYISISTGISAPLQIYAMWNDIQWNVAIVLTISQLIGGYIGTSLLFLVKSVWMVRVLGIFFGLLTLQYIVTEALGLASNKRKFQSDIEQTTIAHQEIALTPIQTQSTDSPILLTDITQSPSVSSVSSPSPSYFSLISEYSLIVFVGVCAGLLGGLFGTPGPPLMLYVTYSTLTKNQIRGTLAVSYTFGTYERLFLLLFLPNSPLETQLISSISIALCILMTCLIGRYVGESVSQLVDERLFRRIIMMILLIGSITMMTTDCSLSLQLMILIILSISYSIFGYLIYSMRLYNDNLERWRKDLSHCLNRLFRGKMTHSYEYFPERS